MTDISQEEIYNLKEKMRDIYMEHAVDEADWWIGVEAIVDGMHKYYAPAVQTLKDLENLSTGLIQKRITQTLAEVSKGQT